MRIGFVTDSTCDLPSDLVEQHAIEVVPSILVLEGREIADGPGISRHEFYSGLPRWEVAPTTAAPSSGEFGARYQRLLDHGCDHILSIHAAASLTAIVAAAGQAARDFDGRVTVVDSHSLSLGLGFQVLAAAEAAPASLEAALHLIESARHRLRLFAALDSLIYARRSGRISAAVGTFGTLLHVRPVAELTDGSVKVVAATRTAGQANDRLAAYLQAEQRLERLAILHAGAEARARQFLARIMRESSRNLPHDILLVNVTPVIGAHVGPGAIGFAALRVQS